MCLMLYKLCMVICYEFWVFWDRNRSFENAQMVKKQRIYVLHSGHGRHLCDEPIDIVLPRLKHVSMVARWMPWTSGTGSLPECSVMIILLEIRMTCRPDDHHSFRADCHALIWLVLGHWLDFSCRFYFWCLFDDILMSLMSIDDIFWEIT